ELDPAELAGTIIGSEPPFTLLELDAVRNAVERQRSERDRAEQTLRDAEQSLEAARSALAQAESARRLAREAASAAAGERDDGSRRRTLALQELEARVARSQVRLRQTERRNAEAELAMARRSQERWHDGIAFVRSQLRASESALGEARTSLEKEVFDLERRIERAKVELAAAEARQAAAQQRFGSVEDPAPALREEAAARRLEVSLHQRELALLGERLLQVQDAQEHWTRRHRLLVGDVERALSLAWLEETRGKLEEEVRQARIRSGRIDELRRDVETLRTRLASVAADSRDAHWISEQIAMQARLIALYEEDQASLEGTRRLETGLVEELQLRGHALDLAGRLGAAWVSLGEIWSYEVATSEDSPITVGKIASAIAVFLVGYLLARTFSRGLGYRLFRRFGLEEGASHAFQSLTFYALLVLIFVASLRIVNIPLTALAFVGGAVAIGVGFGSQNVVSNFISGVILLAERPIKLGDLVEVGGIYGSVERIGLRSTRVRTGDNIHVIVPNASFLESNVVNWTHTDERVRVSVDVGVAYGSATREVERLIREALAEHPRVEKSPDPVVLFTNFGENSLEFRALFWIRMRRQLDRLSVESELRFRIDDLFREAGIVIAFPQRDVHLDAASPLEVRVVRSGPEAG
ncbi:MAG: mechanosensitive ion channel, partial [Myxococcales bacterium]